VGYLLSKCVEFGSRRVAPHPWENPRGDGPLVDCFRSEEGSGARQCSCFEGRINKSELCKGTAGEVLSLVCLRSEGSGAK